MHWHTADRPCSRRFFVQRLTAVVALAASASTARAESAPSNLRNRARALEERLLAPCCWNQTLEVHESELAASLRAEIERRLLEGETGEVIEDELAARYGDRIRAVPKGNDVRQTVPAAVGVSMMAALLGLVLLSRCARHGELPLSYPPALSPG